MFPLAVSGFAGNTGSALVQSSSNGCVSTAVSGGWSEQSVTLSIKPWLGCSPCKGSSSLSTTCTWKGPPWSRVLCGQSSGCDTGGTQGLHVLLPNRSFIHYENSWCCSSSHLSSLRCIFVIPHIMVFPMDLQVHKCLALGKATDTIFSGFRRGVEIFTHTFSAVTLSFSVQSSGLRQ